MPKGAGKNNKTSPEAKHAQQPPQKDRIGAPTNAREEAAKKFEEFIDQQELEEALAEIATELLSDPQCLGRLETVFTYTAKRLRQIKEVRFRRRLEGFTEDARKLKESMPPDLLLSNKQKREIKRKKREEKRLKRLAEEAERARLAEEARLKAQREKEEEEKKLAEEKQKREEEVKRAEQARLVAEAQKEELERQEKERAAAEASAKKKQGGKRGAKKKTNANVRGLAGKGKVNNRGNNGSKKPAKAAVTKTNKKDAKLKKKK